jgi:hypothetical protein
LHGKVIAGPVRGRCFQVVFGERNNLDIAGRQLVLHLFEAL